MSAPVHSLRALSRTRHVLLTGAAGAIGAALSRTLAVRAPQSLFTLVDKDADGVAGVARELGPRASALVCDLARTEDLPGAYEAASLREPVDALVNCAGIMELRTFTGTPWSLGSRLLDVDLTGPLRLMSLAVPGMQSRRRGIVVNVASLAGVLPLRGAAFYGAAKAGLAAASEIARIELADAGVHVVTVYPGPIASGLERGARAQVRASWLTRRLPMGSAEALAERIAQAMD